MNFAQFGVNFLNVPAFYIENAQKGLCKAKFAKFACVNDKKYSMSGQFYPTMSRIFLSGRIFVRITCPSGKPGTPSLTWKVYYKLLSLFIKRTNLRPDHSGHKLACININNGKRSSDLKFSNHSQANSPPRVSILKYKE